MFSIFPKNNVLIQLNIILDIYSVKTVALKLISDVWIQYDGVLNPLPEKSVFRRLQSIVGYDYYEKKMEKNIAIAAKYYFPKWRHFLVNGTEFSGVDMIENVHMVCEGLMKNVMLHCKKWKFEADCKDFLGKVIIV